MRNTRKRQIDAGLLPAVLSWLTVLLLQGCVSGPDYEQPVVHSGAGWIADDQRETAVDGSLPVRLDWWRTLGDPVLNELIEEAVRHNPDLRIAGANVRRARALRQIADAGRYPEVNAGATVRREGLSENAGLPAGQVPGIPVDRTYYEVGFDASWELDIFGGVRRSNEAADARLAVSEENRRGVLLSVLAETARNYMELRGVQQHIEISQKNIALQRQTLDLTEQRYRAGEASQFELAAVKAQLALTEADLPNLHAELRAAAYRLAVLTGREPQMLLESLLHSQPLPLPPEVVPVGLRSELLRRRPDVRSAERQLAAEVADIGVAEAALFPSFALTGGIAQQSIAFSDLLQHSSSAWLFGPVVRWPVFRAGEIRAAINAETAQSEAAAYQYEKTVLAALADAETSLARYVRELETYAGLLAATTAQRHVLELARQRYAQGEDSLLAVIDVERNLAATESELLQSKTRVLVGLVNLYKALGGGWEKFAVDG